VTGISDDSAQTLVRDLAGRWGRQKSDRKVATMTRKKVLVVEDNEDNRRILVYRLRKIGDFEILEAQNGLEAIDMNEKYSPDLIFMDLKMPVMDGWEATKRIRVAEGGRRVAIIALTAQAMAGDEQKALAIGCDDYLAKPVVDPEMVREKVERLLKKYSPKLVAVH
jgi:CheY-like chemotaxis protein